ncbi:MAG: calcium/sodium antiporter [Clostridia bacterium]|nr:calcium/sodium antiporter [Clostridia bacterium]
MIIPILLFILGLILLIKGGDWFVDGATGLARRFKLPEILIGATVVSIGTTLPEVMVSSSAAIIGNGEIAYGNAIGSIICNTALISAITIAVSPSKIDKKSLIIPVIFFFIAATFYSGISYTTGNFKRWTGITLIALFIVYMVITVLKMLKNKTQDIQEEKPEILDKLPFKQELVLELKGERTSVVRELILLVLGAVAIAFGADFLVENGTKIATMLGVPDSVIALTFVALGTSLPELVTAITSLVKGHGSLSLGNIIGANLFNLVLVSGVSITISPFSIPAESILFGQNASLVLDIPVMLSVMLLLTVPTLITGKLKRWQGIVLLLIYASYCTIQFIM